MTRYLYRWLIALHPPQFRSRFGNEILCIFDEAGVSAAWPLLVDALISLSRQWVLRSGFPKMLAALLGAALQLTLAGFGWVAAIHWAFASTFAPPRGTPTSREAGMLLLLIAGLISAILLGATALAVWCANHCTRKLRRTPGRAERNGHA